MCLQLYLSNVLDLLSTLQHISFLLLTDLQPKIGSFRSAPADLELKIVLVFELQHSKMLISSHHTRYRISFSKRQQFDSSTSAIRIEKLLQNISKLPKYQYIYLFPDFFLLKFKTIFQQWQQKSVWDSPANKLSQSFDVIEHLEDD